MSDIPIGGGGAGNTFGKGFVYVMEDTKRNQAKIGCSRDPENREKQLQRGRPDTTLVGYTKANEMNRAETAAQHAVEKHLGMEKVERNATDWYHLPKGVTSEDVYDRARRAVYDHNRKN
ncbi:hypothetical protein ACJMK2_011909 [Sinanodonta woodiana]|uniref:Bacteriophage T5 Orf172 DNA-binding domain-containing protein n=1 Tax=Sinanodonta woodiana TaxID=1069815 RepID=A0ABD3V6H6_SINWO